MSLYKFIYMLLLKKMLPNWKKKEKEDNHPNLLKDKNHATQRRERQKKASTSHNLYHACPGKPKKE